MAHPNTLNDTPRPSRTRSASAPKSHHPRGLTLQPAVANAALLTRRDVNAHCGRGSWLREHRVPGVSRSAEYSAALPLSAVKQPCRSASPGLNRVFRPLHSASKFCSIVGGGRRICQGLDVSGVVSTAPPATVLNRSGMPRSVLPGESGGCSTRLCCGRGSSCRPGYPTVGAAGQIRESRGERPCSLGRPFGSKSGGHRRLPLRGVRDTGRRG
jgi:hypothetical protein